AREHNTRSAHSCREALQSRARLAFSQRRLLQEARYRLAADPGAPLSSRKPLQYRASRLRSPGRLRFQNPRRTHPIPPVMLDLTKYSSIGAALKDAVERFAAETCLIESDREREKDRLTYAEFGKRALALARPLQDAGFSAADRASIIMTNQSKWLVSAYAIFYAGGVLVPLDYKLTPAEHWQLLQHSGAKVLITEYPIWRQLATSTGRAGATSVQTVLVTEAPPNAELLGARRWEEFRSESAAPKF